VVSSITAPTTEPSALEALRTVAPSRPWVAVPFSMSSSATRFARFAGMAKPTPIEPDVVVVPPALAIATLMPTSSPLSFTRAPPELPGLIAASVWITGIEIEPEPDVACWPGISKLNGPVPPSLSSSVPSSGTADDAIWMLRSSALTIPSVTVFDRPSGAPIATTRSPTSSASTSPKSIGVRPLASTSLMTARSTIGSVPTTSALKMRPSAVVTSIVPSLEAPSRVTTWLLVRM
jgi:hypothetical protein